jgi:hypothetical protein
MVLADVACAKHDVVPSGLEQGHGAREGGPQRWQWVRQCNLVAQSKGTPQGRLQTSGGLPSDGQRNRAWEIIYFKLYKSQLPVVERALEIAALMLGTDKSRGYCLETICADFLAGAAVEVPAVGRSDEGRPISSSCPVSEPNGLAE